MGKARKGLLPNNEKVIAKLQEQIELIKEAREYGDWFQIGEDLFQIAEGINSILDVSDGDWDDLV